MKKKKKKNYGTSGGVEITDELIEKLAAEAAAGIDIHRLRPRRGRPPIGTEAGLVFQVRLEPELREALAKKAESDGITASELVRRLLRHHLGASSAGPQRRATDR